LRDYALPVGGTWIKSVFVAVVFVDRPLAGRALNPGGVWFFVDAGERYLVINAQSFTPDRVACILNPAWTPTTLPDGAYYVPPPWQFGTPEGYPLARFWAFPVTVLP